MRLTVKVSELQLWSLETGLQAKQIIKRDYNLYTARCDPSRVPAYLTPSHVVCTGRGGRPAHLQAHTTAQTSHVCTGASLHASCFKHLSTATTSCRWPNPGLREDVTFYDACCSVHQNANQHLSIESTPRSYTRS